MVIRDQAEHNRRRMVEMVRRELHEEAIELGASVRLVDRAQNDDRTSPGASIAVSAEAHDGGRNGWTVTIRRQPHHTEGNQARRFSQVLPLAEKWSATLREGPIARALRPLARLQRRDATLRGLGYASDHVPTWAYTMHRAARLVLEHYGIDLSEAATPSLMVTDTNMMRWPSKDANGIQSKLIGIRTSDLELVDIRMAGMRMISRTIDVRQDGERMFEIEQIGSSTQIVLYQTVPETIVQALAGRDLSALGHPAFQGETGVTIVSAGIVEDGGVVVRLKDLQDPTMTPPAGVEAPWLTE